MTPEIPYGVVHSFTWAYEIPILFCNFSVVLTISTTLIQPNDQKCNLRPEYEQWREEEERQRERGGERENGLKFYIIWHKELYRIQGFVSTMISSPLLSQSNNELVHCLWKYHEFQLRHVRKRAQHNHSLSVKNTHEMKKSETKTETDTHTKKQRKRMECIALALALYICN